MKLAVVIAAALFFGTLGECLKCRTENDLRSEEEFDDIVRICLRMEEGSQPNAFNGNRRGNNRNRNKKSTGKHGNDDDGRRHKQNSNDKHEGYYESEDDEEDGEYEDDKWTWPSLGSKKNRGDRTQSNKNNSNQENSQKGDKTDKYDDDEDYEDSHGAKNNERNNSRYVPKNRGSSGKSNRNDHGPNRRDEDNSNHYGFNSNRQNYNCGNGYGCRGPSGDPNWPNTYGGGYDHWTYGNKWNRENFTRHVGSPLDDVEPVNDNSYLDRASVLSVLTRRVRDQELKNFIREAVQSCFDRLTQEQHRDKCEISKSFALCMEEKGKTNCEDWYPPDRNSFNRRNPVQFPQPRNPGR